MKKSLLIKLLIITMLLSSALCVLAGCGHTHDYTIVKYNENTHWIECECGDKANIEGHKGGTATCTAKSKCEWCNVEYGPLAEHVCGDDGYCTICDRIVGATKGIIYELSEDGSYAEVLGYEGSSTRIVIADTYLGKPVTSIYRESFKNNTSITSVVIPTSITSIGNSAFLDCDSLQTVKFGENSQLTSIGNFAFGDCDSLTSIEIPSSVTSIGNRAFFSCSNMQTIKFGENSQLTSIGVTAFSSCSSLTSIEIPSSVTSIGVTAFSSCTSLEAIEIPSSVTSIGDLAFEGCSNLQTVTVPEDLAVTYGMFGATSLQTTTENNLKYLKLNDNPYYLLYGCSNKNLSTYTINENTKYISDSVFSACSRLTNITLPTNLKGVGYEAFYECSNLQTVTFGENSQLTSIGSNAFRDCYSLTSIEIPNSVTSIGSFAFYWCSKLQTVTVPEDLVVTYDMFEYTSLQKTTENNLKYLKLNDNPYYLLYECSNKNLSTYTINENTKHIGRGVFSSCSRLTNITLPTNLKGIGYDAFFGCSSLEAIEIPSSVTWIGSYAFYDCESLQTVTFGENSQLTSIGNYAFRYCFSLTSIEIPSSVTSIGEQAFFVCSSLTSVVIGDSVTSIGNYAFYDCSSLEAIEIPSSVTSIGDNAFEDCSNLQKVTFNGTIEEWKAVTKGTDWKNYTNITKVICSNGEVAV